MDGSGLPAMLRASDGRRAQCPEPATRSSTCGFNMKIIINESKIKELLTRGVK